jgi:hypothetical protein
MLRTSKAINPITWISHGLFLFAIWSCMMRRADYQRRGKLKLKNIERHIAW